MITGDPTGMNEWLAEAGGLPDNHHVRRRILPFYEAEWKLFCGDYEGLKKILDRQGRDLEPHDYTELLALYLVREDRFKEASEVLAKRPTHEKRDQGQILVEADIIEKESGKERSMAYLSNAVQQHPEMWSVGLRYAYGLTDGKNQSGREEAVMILRKIEKERAFDWMTQLYIAKAYADLGKLKDAMAILRRVKHLMRYVPYYHIVLGNVGYLLGKNEEAYEHAMVAMHMAPRNASALWLAYALAKDKNYSDALAILKQLVALDPRDIVRMAELLEMYDLAREWSCIPELADRILNSKRHVDADVRAKTQALRDKANANVQGGKQDACSP